MNQVHYNRSMLLAAMLPMLLIVVSCSYLLIDGAQQVRQQFLFGILENGYFFYPILTVIFITFAQYAWQPMRKLLRQKPALRWGKAGISLPNGSRIAWKAIEDIQLHVHHNQSFVLLHLDEPQAFIDMQYGERQRLARQCWQRFRAPVAINCSELAITPEDLCHHLQSQWQHSKPS